MPGQPPSLPPLGRKAWEHDYLNLSADDWLRHMERVQVHQPFRDMELCRADAQGSHVWISISGELPVSTALEPRQPSSGTLSPSDPSTGTEAPTCESR